MMKPRKRSTAGRQEPRTSVAKALAVLRAFIDGQDQWGVRELASRIAQPPSTAHRLLSRLRLEGFLDYDEARQKYRIGFEFFRLAAAVNERHGFKQVALPIMRELTERSGESVWLVLHDSQRFRMACVAEQPSPHPLRYAAPLGREETLIDSACGLAVLAALPDDERRATLAGLRGRVPANLDRRLCEIRDAGYATTRACEAEAAMMIAVEVRDIQGYPTGSLAVVVPMHRFGSGRELVLGELVRDYATRLSHRLGARLLGGASAGTWHDAVALISELLHREAPGLMVTPALGGGGRNLEDLDRGLGTYGLTTAASLHQAFHGRKPFNCRHERLRAVMNLSELQLLVISRRGLAVDGIGDLAGLRVSPGEQGFSAAQVFEELLHLARVPRQHTERKRGAILYLDYPEAKRRFEAGALDVLIWLTGVSNRLVQEIHASTPSRLRAIAEPLLRRLAAGNPGYRVGPIAASAFPRWLKADAQTLIVPTVLVCTAGCAESEVYEVARTVFEHRAELALMSSVYSRIDARFAVADLAAPLHPGAARYFREIGAEPGYAVADLQPSS
ncbi:MAG: hypothetical protein A3G24_08445 [Betaproteobacteria bacterium RIFCSPLOWO2_12_FULL_62_13]|nr:MAG: hypothetical protein A3G24_08445 [Betaproteobacteria bacterium RIFCSPLOWO2_12_FULL_62_13]